MIIEFEDYDQDFLRWEIDNDGKIIGCEPFQASVWCGKYVFDPKGLTIKGKVLICDTAPDPTNLEQEFRTINYPIKKLIING